MVQVWVTLFKVGKHSFRVVNRVQGWEIWLKVGLYDSRLVHGSKLVNMVQG